MHVVVIAGGIGGARFLTGVRDVVAGAGGEVTAIVNTADDITLHGLRVCPDLDSVMYTLGGGIDPQRGWGRDEETFTVIDELRAYGVEPTWFGLGDRDIATHLVRTQLHNAGVPLSTITRALCDRWRPGVTLLPMTDERVETHVVVEGKDPGTRRAIHFQEWWVRHRAQIPALEFVQVGAEGARPAPGVLAALRDADAILLAPSNPVVSVAPVLGVGGQGSPVRTAIRQARARVVGLSPIVGGRAVRGMAEACLSAVGVASTAEAVGRWYGCHAAAEGSPEHGAYGLLDAWLVHATDDAVVPGVDTRAVPLLMTDPAATAAMARAALAAAGVDL